MSSPQQFLYRVWVPGQSPNSAEPALTLHNAAALKFFVRAGSLLFPDTPFHVYAYHLVNELMERPVAEGRYQLHRLANGRVEIFVVEQHGIHAEGSNRNLITAALKAACDEVQA